MTLHFAVYNSYMLRPILRTRETEWILLYLASRGSGYAQEIADFFDANYRSVQRQLERLEAGGVLAAKRIGKTKLYEFDPRYPFKESLKTLLSDVKSYYPPKLIKALDFNRRRPRRSGKPL